jgi:hypothetical protein
MKLRFGLFALALSASAAGAQTNVNMTLSGGNPGGLWSLLGAGIDRAARMENDASVVTYQATGGGFANIAAGAALFCRQKTPICAWVWTSISCETGGLRRSTLLSRRSSRPPSIAATMRTCLLKRVVVVRLDHRGPPV